MFNLFFSTLIFERLHGKKLPVLLAERTGTTERTWRNRTKNGWQPTSRETELYRDAVIEYLTNEMNMVGGYSAEEAQEIIARSPSSEAGVGLPTADLIFWSSQDFGEYREAIALATRFDEYCNSLNDAAMREDIEPTRRVLLDALAWLRSYCTTEPDIREADALALRLEDADDIKALQEVSKYIGEAMIFHVISCWDVEFCSGYFQAQVEACPLFALMMPRLAPDVTIEKDTGKLLRNGQQPKKNLFDKSTSRLFDFLAVLAYLNKKRRFPQKIPMVKEMAAWSMEYEAKIVSWRDETTRFTLKQFQDVWENAISPDKNGKRICPPLPMLIATCLWSPLLVREDGKPKQWIDCIDGYESWWTINVKRLTAKGIKFGKTPWPACLTDRAEGNRLLAHFRSD